MASRVTVPALRQVWAFGLRGGRWYNEWMVN